MTKAEFFKITKAEFLEYVSKNNINLGKYNFVVGEKSNTPYTVGCYKEGEKWYLYEVGERQDFGILASGDEKEIFSRLYFRLRGEMGM